MAKRKSAPKKTKNVPGKSTNKNMKAEMYKPSLYLDGKQIPKELKDAKPGATVEMTVKAKLVRRSESIGSDDSVMLEIDQMGTTKKRGKKS